MATQSKKVSAKAKCASFDIEVTAKIVSTTLTKSEIEDVQRKFRHQLTTSVSKLPFAHIYPNEVVTR